MPTRTGILCVPQLDDQAADAIMPLLRTDVPDLLVLQVTAAANQRRWLEELLRQWCDEDELDLIISIGGTAPAAGPAAAEVVPDATAAVVERFVPGLAEAMRAYAAQESRLAWLERGVVGIRGRTLLINLPAGAAPAVLFLEGIVDLIAPLLAHLHEATTAPQLRDQLELQSAPTAPVVEPSSAKPGLDRNEFAAFLQRRQSD
jgi:molybdopterin biosynthesis enzyme MoaB